MGRAIARLEEEAAPAGEAWSRRVWSSAGPRRRLARGRGGGADERRWAGAGCRRGYRTAMNRHGLAARVRVLPGGLTEEDGAAAARTLLAQDPRPTAVLAFNDRCATGEAVVPPRLVVRGTTAAPRAR
ncbi:substrate-binding domain-containing protein [Streptomyces sp. TP-A0356]|uniref:substrate-binding domain-containing protein n=1 Tax=Streptomyces sp. TP-A0356 TaxID=1359208 RepID=UPI0006E1E668